MHDIEDSWHLLPRLAAGHSESLHSLSATHTAAIRLNLLQWYDSNRRQLPWRGDAMPHGKETFHINPSPYAVWVSEIMCQQTRIATVIEYFQRWMTSFPTVQDLAAADLEVGLGGAACFLLLVSLGHLFSVMPLQTVNQHWAGLGYYRRARLLHQGAQYVVKELNGDIPSTKEGLMKIPGIGEYTAGAIASISFGQQVPVVDGNVIRVLSRLRTIVCSPKNTVAVKHMW